MIRAQSKSGTDGFHGISFNQQTSEVRPFSFDELDQELGDQSVFSWIDIESPEIGQLNSVLQTVGIDLILVSHFSDPEVLPRIVERPDCLAFYLYEIVNPERHLDTSRGLTPIEFARMILVLGHDYVITYHQRPLDAVDYVKATCPDSFRLAGKSPGFIAFLFLQRCQYDYAHLNLANDNFLDALEESVLTRDEKELAERITIAGLNILTLKKMVASLHIVLMIMGTKKSPFISDEARATYSEMLQNAASIRAAVDSSRDLLDGVLGSVQAAAANRTSDIARVLTVISAIILPLTLISGIYGMNFDYMPELRWKGGYFLVLGVMGGLALALILIFKALGWMQSDSRKMHQ